MNPCVLTWIVGKCLLVCGEGRGEATHIVKFEIETCRNVFFMVNLYTALRGHGTQKTACTELSAANRAARPERIFVTLRGVRPEETRLSVLVHAYGVSRKNVYLKRVTRGTKPLGLERWILSFLFVVANGLVSGDGDGVME